MTGFACIKWNGPTGVRISLKQKPTAPIPHPTHPPPITIPLQGSTMAWCRSNAISFIQNSHNRHHIARLWGRGMRCLLWVRSLIAVRWTEVFPWIYIHLTCGIVFNTHTYTCTYILYNLSNTTQSSKIHPCTRLQHFHLTKIISWLLMT